MTSGSSNKSGGSALQLSLLGPKYAHHSRVQWPKHHRESVRQFRVRRRVVLRFVRRVLDSLVCFKDGIPPGCFVTSLLDQPISKCPKSLARRPRCMRQSAPIGQGHDPACSARTRSPPAPLSMSSTRESGQSFEVLESVRFSSGLNRVGKTGYRSTKSLVASICLASSASATPACRSQSFQRRAFGGCSGRHASTDTCGAALSM